MKKAASWQPCKTFCRYDTHKNLDHLIKGGYYTYKLTRWRIDEQCRVNEHTDG